MNTNQNLKILELRNYLLKPGVRDRFINYFAAHFVDSQKALGSCVLGQFTVKDEPDKFFWMRGFEDMPTRLEFLRAFYEKGEVWKRFGGGANEMIIDSDDVYLLKPLNGESFNGNRAYEKEETVVIEFYFAKENQLDELIHYFQTNYIPIVENKPTLWTSEMSVNDFPRLPAIQDPNLLVLITGFRNESDYRPQAEQSAVIIDRVSNLLARKSDLILYRANTRCAKP